MLELSVLFILILVLILALYITGDQPILEEGFDNFYLSSCPSGYTSGYNTNGDILCCDGKIMANTCLGEKQCILNGKGTKEIPNCVDRIRDEYEYKAQSNCPSSLPIYFEDREKKTKGCTNGPLNETMTGPKKTTQPMCMLYSDWNENVISKDSCYNAKLLDKAECFGKNCRKELVQPTSNAPPLVAIHFTDSSGMFRTAYLKESMKNHLDVVNPEWKHQGINLEKSINVAEVAKAVYVDKTKPLSEVQFT